MKWRILAAILFAWLIFAGMQSLSVAEQPGIPPQLSALCAEECTLPPATQQMKTDALRESSQPAVVSTAPAPQPLLCSSNGTPLLSQSYVRTAYQAFHFSDCAG